MHLRLASTLALLSLLACRPSDPGGDPGGDAGSDASTGDGDGDSTSGDGDDDPTSGDGDGDPTSGDGDGDLLGGKLRIGINHGHRNSNWGDAQDSELSRDAGCNS